jgi:hypothetical protein
MMGANVLKGSLSFIISTNGLYLLDHDNLTNQDALDAIRNPSYDRIKWNAQQMMV